LEIYEKDKKPIIIIWSIQKVSTGFDYPIIDTVFIYSSIKFEATVIQSVWRCLRKFKDKTKVQVILWNDTILAKQRTQKMQAIMWEYWVTKKDIREIKIWQELWTIWSLALTF
jgi:superfamily II DNA or RNA helicase